MHPVDWQRSKLPLLQWSLSSENSVHILSEYLWKLHTGCSPGSSYMANTRCMLSLENFCSNYRWLNTFLRKYARLLISFLNLFRGCGYFKQIWYVFIVIIVILMEFLLSPNVTVLYRTYQATHMVTLKYLVLWTKKKKNSVF